MLYEEIGSGIEACEVGEGLVQLECEGDISDANRYKQCLQGGGGVAPKNEPVLVS